MDKRIEVRCSEEELAGWKRAAGPVPLSRWVRRVLSEAAGREGVGVPLTRATYPELHAAVGGLAAEESEPFVLPDLRERSFRPDFKGGKR